MESSGGEAARNVLALIDSEDKIQRATDWNANHSLKSYILNPHCDWLQIVFLEM